MKKVGIIAGNGRFPLVLVKAIKLTGSSIVCIALKEEADVLRLHSICDTTYCVSIGQFQKIINILKNENVNVVLMAGQVRHISIYSLLNLDLRARSVFKKLVNKKADTILNAITNEFNKDGLSLISPANFLSNMFIYTRGLLCGKRLSRYNNKDIQFGYSIAKSIARLDIGQTVVVKDRSVLAVESVEGTDECIKRAYQLGGDNIVVVKVSKPNQDMRFDVPVIGLQTIDVLKENKVRVLAIEAGKTLILDTNDVIKKAKQLNITIIAI
ncbi:MAG: UDP-2,3-diacylglucosamine diphosphatase LpxI [Endomicrobium sp.]|jgi:DUF1009 family protein|nr:UDP-2,3-diacylglucosamine diphosphatase LpxI [Endomicrobium sp.]